MMHKTAELRHLSLGRTFWNPMGKAMKQASMSLDSINLVQAYWALADIFLNPKRRYPKLMNQEKQKINYLSIHEREICCESTWLSLDHMRNQRQLSYRWECYEKWNIVNLECFIKWNKSPFNSMQCLWNNWKPSNLALLQGTPWNPCLHCTH